MSWASRTLMLLACVAAALTAGSAARADGDPASDYLISQEVYFPFGQSVSPEKQEQLVELVRAAKEKGFEVRIAIIGSPVDLGAVRLFWRRKPQDYARFLGRELSFFYPRRLLIVMPKGYGIYQRGVDRSTELELLKTLPTPRRDLVGAAELAVERLAASHDIHVGPGATGSSQTRNRLVIVAIVLAVLIALALVKAFRIARRPTARGAGR
jgi:hypothetical protein